MDGCGHKHATAEEATKHRHRPGGALEVPSHNLDLANQLLCCTYLSPEQGGWSLRWSRTSQKEASHYVSPESGL